MSTENRKPIENLILDTTAFIQMASLHDIAENLITCQEVVDEIKNRRQLRRLVTLPYNLLVQTPFPENIKIITEFSKLTGDYPSLSATDIKVMALTYQIEKEKNGVQHLKTTPVLARPIINTERLANEINPDITGFYLPEKDETIDGDGKGETSINDSREELDTPSNVSEKKDNLSINDETNVVHENLASKFATVNLDQYDLYSEDNLTPTPEDEGDSYESDSYSEDDSIGWITPNNITQAKKQVNSQLMEEKYVSVSCMTTDFAMQNVLKQMNLNVSALDGRIIKQLRTYILRCYTCFKTTSVMTKRFCPKCGNNTLKKVAVSVDENGKVQLHINPRKLLTGRGKKFSIPRIKGGKHPNNPILVEDQPMPDNKPSRLAQTQNNPFNDDYIAGFSPFIMRDVNSKSAQLGIRLGSNLKHWMKKNPNESRRKRK